MRILHTLLAFNRGIVSRLALARTDVQRLALSAEVMTNWMPRLLGSMMLRPGTTFLHSTKSDAAARHLPFVFSTDDTAQIELTNSVMRVVVGGALVTRAAVTTTITNGSFTTDVASWADNDEVGATSGWATGGYLSLLGDGTNEARRDQTLTVAGANIGVEHALAIKVLRGNVRLRLGSTTAGSSEYGSFTLRPGRHSIAVTPTGNLYVRLAALTTAASIVDSVAIEAAGPMEVATPWLTANLDMIRSEQSGDVIFVACEGHQQRRVERQNSRSWSIAEYLTSGPYRDENTTEITLAASALSGTVTLTANKAFFYPTHVGATFRLQSSGQNVASALSAADTFTSDIRVTGITNGRLFGLAIVGTFVGTVTLQRSLGTSGTWSDVTSYTVPVSTTYNDALDNQIVYYRFGFKAGNYTSGSATCSLAYDAGTALGIARVISYSSSTLVSADVEDDMGSVTATSAWWESAWSDYRGWPTAVGFHDGRLWWASSNRIDGSVSDDFANYDDQVEGDSGAIRRSIGSGPVDTINWILSLGQLLVGTEGMELMAKSSSFDEPLTPAAFTLKGTSTYGSSGIGALRVDTSGVYVGRNGARLYEIAPDANGYSYTSTDLTVLNPELLSAGVVRAAVQRFPDTRVHCVRADGTVNILLFDRLEKVNCWVQYETDGLVEDVVVTPGDAEDTVHYVVKRTINGSTKRYFEKWNLETEAVGTAGTKLADCGIVYSGASTVAMTGLSYLEGKTVCVWGNTKDLGTYVVTGGAITLSEAVTLAYIGLPYTANFQSARLSVASAAQAPLTQRKRVDHLGVVLADVHHQGLKYGQDSAHLDDMPSHEGGALVAGGTIASIYDEDSFELNGTWDTDARLYLRAQAPRSVTVLAAIIGVAGHDK